MKYNQMTYTVKFVDPLADKKSHFLLKECIILPDHSDGKGGMLLPHIPIP